MKRPLAFSASIKEALDQAMECDDSVICYGLGIDDPKGIFGTTLGLKEKFGANRVFDMPTSENGMTGIGIGASLNGIRPVMMHQRIDFFMLAMDQLVNNAAKWHYVFNGGRSVPITIRLVIGRGWGQGPTHSQSLQAFFSHIPGLKVVMPSCSYDAKGLLLASIRDDNPVVFIEHRWLHNNVSDVPEKDYIIPIGKAKKVREGSDLTIVGMSYMTIEALHVVDELKEHGVHCEVIDLRTVKPIDWNMIVESVQKTGKLLVLDTAVETGSIAGEIIAKITSEYFDTLKVAPQRLNLPDCPSPASAAYAESYYRGGKDIYSKIKSILNLNENITVQTKPLHDVPGDWFRGPF